MDTTLFNYNKTGIELLQDLLNRTHTLELDFSQIVLSPPQALLGCNTKVTVAPAPNTSLTGVVQLYYDRICLDELFYGYRLKLTGETPTVESVNEYLRSNYQINLNLDFTLTETYHGENYPVIYTIAALPESYLWMGELTLWYLPESSINNLITDRDLTNNTKFHLQNGFIYSMSKTFSEPSVAVKSYFSVGKQIYTNEPPLTIEVLEYLKLQTQDDWVITDTIENFNLHQAQVLYHGPTVPESLEYAIVIQLGTRSKNLYGNLIVHYRQVLTP